MQNGQKTHASLYRSICGSSLKLGVTRGCPQGGILSPILWCMVIDSLLVQLNDSGIFTQGYSDDVASLVTGDFIDTVGDLMRTALKTVEKWCLENKLTINPVKTKMILFSKRRSTENSKVGEFTLFNKEVSLVATVKYLGVILDNKLTWLPHLAEKLNKAIGIFWLCRNAFGRNWGLSPKAIWWIYTAVIRPILCHGCVVWWPRVEVQLSKKRLDKLQRLACLCMTSVKNTVATLALETLLDLPPLDLYIKATAFNTSFNIQINECWQPSLEKGHTTIRNLIKTDELLMPSDQMKSVVMLDDEYEWLIPGRKEWLGEERSYPRSDGITCYTDGSKNENLSESGSFCKYLKLNGSI